MKVLVTGGAGYIGSVLVHQLLSEGHDVHVLDLLLHGVPPTPPTWTGDGGRPVRRNRYTLWAGDIRDSDAVAEAADGVDAIVHLAAIVGDPACRNCDYTDVVTTNLGATRQIAERAKAAGQKFVFASTCSVYGHSDGLVDEWSPVNPISLYAHTKVAAEEFITNLGKVGTFAPAILRFGTIYGWSPRMRFDLVVNLLAAQAVKEGKVAIFGGDQWRPFVHVSDVARAIIHALTVPGVRGVTNVGGNTENYQLTWVGEIVAQVVRCEVVHRARDDDRSYKVNCDKIRQLGFVPRMTVKDGVREVVENLHGIDYTDPQYSNRRCDVRGDSETARPFDSGPDARSGAGHADVVRCPRTGDGDLLVGDDTGGAPCGLGHPRARHQ